MIPTTARNATLEDLVPMLQAQQAAKVDAVVPASAMRSENGVLQLPGLSVFNPTTPVRPTVTMDGQIADKLGIPVKYLRKLREQRPDLYDANVNGWLHGNEETTFTPEGPVTTGTPADGRKFLVRTFLGDDGEGIGRALLADRYGIIENIDVLMSCLEGIQESGIECTPVTTDLSESRMRVRFAAPGIVAMAPTLLKDYRSPVPGIPADFRRWLPIAEREGKAYEPGKEPVVFGGFEVSNSETGGGAFNLAPMMTVEICGNGLKINAHALRKVHLGSKLDVGQIRWTEDTQRKSLELVKAQTRDAVRAFLDVEFLQEVVRGIEAKAGVEVENPAETIELVASKMSYTQEQQQGILTHFIKGGQATAGGVLNAVTSYAQTVGDPDVAYDLEDKALDVLDLVG